MEPGRLDRNPSHPIRQKLEEVLDNGLTLYEAIAQYLAIPPARIQGESRERQETFVELGRWHFQNHFRGRARS